MKIPYRPLLYAAMIATATLSCTGSSGPTATEQSHPSNNQSVTIKIDFSREERYPFLFVPPIKDLSECISTIVNDLQIRRDIYYDFEPSFTPDGRLSAYDSYPMELGERYRDDIPYALKNCR